jgi:hypothetical protein
MFVASYEALYEVRLYAKLYVVLSLSLNCHVSLVGM